MTLPRDIFTGKMPAVYNTILSLGGVLIPMQPDLAGNVLAYCPDGSTFVGTPAASIDFDRDGQIPRVAGGSPVTTFDNTGEVISFAVPPGDQLQMDGDGTLLLLCTPADIATGVVLAKTSVLNYTRNGYICLLIDNGAIRFATADAVGVDDLQSEAGLYTAGARIFIAYTQSGTTGTLYLNGVQIATGTMRVPTNVASPLAIGGYPAGTASPFIGSGEFAALMKDVVLIQPQIADIAAQCGPLG
jgi:hypothetical protein